MLVNMSKLLADAQKGDYAVGSFSVANMEMVLGVLKAAKELKAPVILQIAEVRLKQSPLEIIGPLMVAAAKSAGTPVAVHFDHGKTIEKIAQALELGFTSVMFDGSHLPLDENIKTTKEVIALAKKDITVDDKVIIPADGLVGTLTVDKDGKNVEHLDLPTGDYYVKELETNVGFKLDEKEHDFTFNYDKDTTKSTVIVPMELHNEKRRIELDVNKVDKDHHDHFLNGAIFEVFDKTTKSHVTTLASGQLMIVGNDVNEEYEISKDEDFTEIIKTAKTDENKQIILDMDDGTYYSRKVGDETVSKHVIKDGKAVLSDAIYGHEYEFKEIKAPTSYQLADKSKAYKVEADKDTDTIIYYFENARIVVPNTGV